MDVKKLLVFILIIALIVLAILGLGKLFKGSKPSKEVQQEVENLTTNYFTTLTSGYATEMDGVDILYQKDKTTYDDLLPAAVIYTAIRYAQENKISLGLTENQSNLLKKNYKEDVPAFKAEGIRKAVKELFGKDLPNQNAEGLVQFKYNYFYNEDTDAYVQMKNPNYNGIIRNEAINVETKVLETTKKGDTVNVTLIVAYVLTTDSNRVYYKNVTGTADDKVGETSDSAFLAGKDEEFQKYTLTMKKVNDKYTFESMEKVK